jgi:DNA-3-methyladenine glycosylase II
MVTEEAINYLRRDKILRNIIDNTELRDRFGKEDIFVSLVGSIVSQQLSVKAAATIYARLLALFPKNKLSLSTLYEMSDESLRAVGLSNQKCAYVKNVALFFLDHPIKKTQWQKLSDEEVINKLTSIKGVGKWTVQMLLMFTLQRPDVMPYDDLIIRNSILTYYNISSSGKEMISDLDKITIKWSPYRTVACLYLWAAKDNLKSFT